MFCYFIQTVIFRVRLSVAPTSRSFTHQKKQPQRHQESKNHNG